MKRLADRLRAVLDLVKRRGAPLSFELLFKRFREVLESNNRSLQIITDMGEKLGGEYIFDITYVKRSYSELFSSVGDSMRSFDSLTRSRYPRLHAAFDSIDDQIRGVIYNRPTSGELILFYEDISWGRYRDVGGKNAHLAELKNDLKVNVPEAFAVTTYAFDEFLRHNGLIEMIESFDGKVESIRKLHSLIVNGEIPPALDAALDAAIDVIGTRCGRDVLLSLRSSANEEDGDFSFAGQFETLLNIPLEGAAVKRAYREVIASLFSSKAVSYQQQSGVPMGSMRMAVACMVMVNARTSGVIYSSSPEGHMDDLIMHASWGLGKSVVEGEAEADFYVVRKDANPNVIRRSVGRKGSMVEVLPGGGVKTVITPKEMLERPCLNTEEIMDLARQAILIERHYRRPQDIEWSIARDGRVFILQTRPLKVQDPVRVIPAPPEFIESGRVLMSGVGSIVQKGAGAGRVFILRRMDELDNFPKGAVLVAGHDSSNFIRVMPYTSAIITDVGTLTSHMSSLCREFRVPTVVNTGNATHILKHGQEITLSVENDSVVVYEGVVEGLIERDREASAKVEDLYEYRKKRYVLRYISPLNLIDPLVYEFTPEGCKTMHDILRFIHEKAVAELIESARYGNSLLRSRATARLDLPIPAGIIVVDIGGGISLKEGKTNASFEEITSAPFRAIIKGMMHPGVWQSGTVSLKVHDFLSSMMRMSDITSEGGEYAGYNLAIVSNEYTNLNLRFGYHFCMIDCYCSENTRDNHVYFRFTGGATDITKRSRRIQLIAGILKDYGFNINTKGDLVIARLSNIRKRELEEILDLLGRLIAYTRQLDALLHDEEAVERYKTDFLEEKYDFLPKE